MEVKITAWEYTSPIYVTSAAIHHPLDHAMPDRSSTRDTYDIIHRFIVGFAAQDPNHTTGVLTITKLALKLSLVPVFAATSGCVPSGNVQSHIDRSWSFKNSPARACSSLRIEVMR